MNAGRVMKQEGNGHASGSGRFPRTVVLFGLIVAAVVLVAAGVQAKQKQVDREERKRPPRVDYLPDMNFMTGTLSLGRPGQWKLGRVPLYFPPDTQMISEEEPEGYVGPCEGCRVSLMGYWRGGSFVVRHGIVKRSWNKELQNREMREPVRPGLPLGLQDRVPQ